MRMRRLEWVVLALVASIGVAYAAPNAVIRELISEDAAAAERAAGVLIGQPAESLAVWIAAFNDFPQPDTSGWAVKLSHPIADTLEAPAYLFIPTGYDPHRPTPLVVTLHGGVGGPKFRDATGKNWLDEPVLQIAEAEGWLVLFPLGKTGCSWWDRTGMENILWLLREAKRRCNVDDDRVAMCGFSDGGSGAFHFAMLAPNDFAVFFPWSGHPGVGALVGKIPAYLPNLRARPLFASNGGADRLYPASEMEPLHQLALDAGARLAVAYYDTAGHNYGYMPAEWSRLPQRLRDHPRDPFPATIYLETADPEFITCDWLTITALDTAAAAREWHREFNVKRIDDRLTIGFNPDTEFKGPGVMVGSVAGDSTLPAMKVGLCEGDVIMRIDEVKIVSMADINRAKEGRVRGDPIRLAVKRGKKLLKFSSAYPPAEEYDAFPHIAPSGAVRATRIGNHFMIETSRVRGFSLSLSPEMVRFDQPVRVTADGKKLFDGVVQPESRLLLTDFLAHRDRRRLTFARLELTIPAE